MSEIFCMVCDSSPCVCPCPNCVGMGYKEIAENDWVPCDKCEGAGFPARVLYELIKRGMLT